MNSVRLVRTISHRPVATTNRIARNATKPTTRPATTVSAVSPALRNRLRRVHVIAVMGDDRSAERAPASRTAMGYGGAAPETSRSSLHQRQATVHHVGDEGDGERQAEVE